MVFWGFSLILVVSFLGPQAIAVPHLQGDRGHLPQPQPFQHPEHTAGAIMAATTSPPVTTGPTAANEFSSPSSSNSAPPSTSSTDPFGPSFQSTSTSASSTTSASAIPTFGYFGSTWSADESFEVQKPGNVYYAIPSLPTSNTGGPFTPVLFVCQTNQTSLFPMDMDSSNTWSVAQVPNNCDKNGSCSYIDTVQTNTVTFDSIGVDDGGFPKDGLFFFCLANTPQLINNFVCNSFGPFFKINGISKNRRDLEQRQAPTPTLTGVFNMPQTPLTITSYSAIVSALGASITNTVLPGSGSTTSMMTVTGSPTTTTTVPASTPTLSSSAASSTSRGLSTGAKVGIALGALVLIALLLLAALFFLRRKHRSRSPPPERVMLTRDMHTDSFGRNALIAEKETAAANNIANASPVDENLPIRRHSTHQPYDSIPAAPYTEAASSVPRRKPTNASAVSRISGPASPRSLTASTPPDEYEEYRDQPMPIYGDARHSPRVYSTEERQGVKAPFLSEEGLSAEEVARLEEEERRIDAAIAEAERSGRR